MTPILNAPEVAVSHKRDMTRIEAAQYITDHWFPCSPKTLAKLAITGAGPAFRKAGRVPLYSVSACDQYGKSKIGPLVQSTRELVRNHKARADRLEKMPGHQGPGKRFEITMFAYPKRGDSRKHFPHLIKRNRFPVAGITAVRHIGPHWIVAGRRPRSIPVFFIRTTMLSVRVVP